jgi:hypothetical protein
VGQLHLNGGFTSRVGRLDLIERRVGRDTVETDADDLVERCTVIGEAGDSTGDRCREGATGVTTNSGFGAGGDQLRFGTLYALSQFDAAEKRFGHDPMRHHGHPAGRPNNRTCTYAGGRARAADRS